jgi:hypothetical protein
VGRVVVVVVGSVVAVSVLVDVGDIVVVVVVVVVVVDATVDVVANVVGIAVDVVDVSVVLALVLLVDVDVDCGVVRVLDCVAVRVVRKHDVPSPLYGHPSRDAQRCDQHVLANVARIICRTRERFAIARYDENETTISTMRVPTHALLPPHTSHLSNCGITSTTRQNAPYCSMQNRKRVVGEKKSPDQNAGDSLYGYCSKT